MNLKSLIMRFAHHELITGSFWLFIGGIFASAFSFLFNLFLARILSYADYGVYTSLLSLFALLTVPSSIFVIVMVKFATTYLSKNDKARASLLYKKSLLTLGIISIILFFAVASLSHLIQAYLHIEDVRLILLVGFAVSLTYFGVVNTAFIRSSMRFGFNAFNLIIGNISKLLVGVLLVLLGYSVGGALFAVASVPFVVFLLGFIPLTYLLKRKENVKKIKIETSEIISYAIPASVTLVALSSFIASDMILVRHFFSAEEAGFYGGLSIVGKVIFYFTASISAVMFPVIVKRHTKRENYHNVFYLSLILISLPSVTITVFYFLFPEFVIRLFLGGREYLSVAPYLWLFGLFITIFNLLSITVNFFLSIKKNIVAFLVPVFAVLQIVLIYIFHENFYQVIYSSVFSITVLLILLWIFFVRTKNY